MLHFNRVILRLTNINVIYIYNIIYIYIILIAQKINFLSLV